MLNFYVDTNQETFPLDISLAAVVHRVRLLPLCAKPVESEAGENEITRLITEMNLRFIQPI